MADAIAHGLRVRAPDDVPGELVAPIEESWTRFRGDPTDFLGVA
jgi:hypothetical protein